MMFTSTFSLRIATKNHFLLGSGSVAQWAHEHRHVRGSVRVEEPDGSHYWTSVGGWSGEYTAETADNDLNANEELILVGVQRDCGREHVCLSDSAPIPLYFFHEFLRLPR